jgi:23S rRNA pseudouridine2604 synthase
MTTPPPKPARAVLRKPEKPVRTAAMAPTPLARAPSAPPRPYAAAQAPRFAPQAPPAPPGNKKPRLRKPPKDSPEYQAPAFQSAAKEDSGERLSKRVMQLRGCSRKEAEQYISGGWVRVNGVVAEEPQRRVDQETVTIDEHANLMAVHDVTLILHKPAGYTDGLEDPEDDDDDEDDAPARRPAARGRKAPLPNARKLLTAAAHWAGDTSGTRMLKRHFQHLDADVELENGASGLVVFTQDWRTTRKLTEDLGVMEHEMLVEVEGEVEPEALKPIGYALKDDRLALPQVKVSVSSSTPAMSRLRFAIKGSHPGLVAYLCGLAGLNIVAMRRVRLGRVTLADLPVGQWRYLADGERF